MYEILKSSRRRSSYLLISLLYHPHDKCALHLPDILHLPQLVYMEVIIVVHIVRDHLQHKVELP